MSEAVAERELTGYVADLAHLFGWRRYHTWLSRHSPAGFPDEVLVRGARLIVAELKSERGKVSAAQVEWLDALGQVPGVETYVWRPSDMDRIAEVLR
jgi:hypothetical protein